MHDLASTLPELSEKRAGLFKGDDFIFVHAMHSGLVNIVERLFEEIL
jgi:hypothetical protein